MTATKQLSKQSIFDTSLAVNKHLLESLEKDGKVEYMIKVFWNYSMHEKNSDISIQLVNAMEEIIDTYEDNPTYEDAIKIANITEFYDFRFMRKPPKYLKEINTKLKNQMILLLQRFIEIWFKNNRVMMIHNFVALKYKVLQSEEMLRFFKYFCTGDTIIEYMYEEIFKEIVLPELKIKPLQLKDFHSAHKIHQQFFALYSVYHSTYDNFIDHYVSATELLLSRLMDTPKGEGYLSWNLSKYTQWILSGIEKFGYFGFKNGEKKLSFIQGAKALCKSIALRDIKNTGDIFWYCSTKTMSQN